MVARLGGVLGAGVLFLVACQPGGGSELKKEAFVGQWMGKSKLSVKEGTAMNDAEKASQRLAETVETPLELKADGTYTLVYVVFPIQGNWSLSGDTIQLTPTQALGRPIDPKQKQEEGSVATPMTLKVAAGGESLVNEEATRTGQVVTTFRRYVAEQERGRSQAAPAEAAKEGAK